ncbi:MAG: dihydroorotate dehydrogenase [Synergistetes bacterium]|nr:dihydroorotate dehydrogenase [Synergistota bacterium]
MLEMEVFGIRFRNPLLVASGPLTDKPDKIKRLARRSIGGIVLKTISTKPAEVKRPLIAKIGCGLLNCELWSEDPPERWAQSFLPEIRKEVDLPIVVSLGYKPEDIQRLVPMLDEFADAFEISTHYTGTDVEPIYRICRAASSLTKKPILIKMSPHFGNVIDFAKAAVDGGASGIVAINSLGPGIVIDVRKRKSKLGEKYGWLSGPPIKPIALRFVYEIRKAVNVPIVGVGGISSALDVIEFMMAGATLVQILSSAILKGVDIFDEIARDLPPLLEELGFKSLGEVIGVFEDG